MPCCNVYLQDLMQHGFRFYTTTNIVGTPLTSEIHSGKAKGRSHF